MSAEPTACKHEHNAECGYKEGKPCTFDTATCESCNPKNIADTIVTLAGEEVYAVYDGSNFYAATKEKPSTATSEEISSTDKTAITNLYIMGEIVPDALMGDAGISANTTLKTVTCADTVTSIGDRAFYQCKALTSVAMPSATTIGKYAFFHGTKLESLTLGATPPTVGKLAFFLEEGVASTRNLSIQGNTAFQDTVLADYKAVADGDTTDGKWWGWTLPTTMDGTGVSNSAGTLEVTTGNSNPTFGAENTITLTASFAKVGENKLRTLTENQISLLNGKDIVESKTATLTDGVYSATFTVQTKDLAAGNYNYTATFDGNRSLVGGAATDTVTVTINKADQAALSISDVPNSVTYGDSNLTLSTTGGSGTGTAVTFADNANIANWAADAVKSMQMAGVIMGKDGNRFDPTATATRAEVSAMLKRYVELVIDKATTH